MRGRRWMIGSSLSFSPSSYPLLKRNARTISSKSIQVQPCQNDTHFLQRPKKEDLQFGTTMSDHMLMIEYENNQWKDPIIQPYQPLSISPAASCLNYGLTCFEGMKAYRSTVDNKSIRLFRPHLNMDRLRSSMTRLHMPGIDFDSNELIECIKELVRIDERWVPEGEGYSLYIRPNVIGINKYLGVAPPDSLLLYVITSPVGPYYKTGFRPIRLKCENFYKRAFPGGTGNTKVGGNYAPTMKPAAEAASQGYAQVLWMLDDDITEVGAMNIFFLFKGGGSRNGTHDKKEKKKILVTPPLSRGDILPGVTRRSILELASTWSDIEVQERNITLTEVKEAAKRNEILEVFGAGTAAVVTPVSGIDDITIHAPGDFTQKIWRELIDIQYGRKIHPDNWSMEV